MYQLFHNSFGYSKSLSLLLTKLCTLNKGLLQGAPTSPYLLNLLTADMDAAIYQFCAANGKLRYTRYADDISISGDMNPSYVISEVSKMVTANYLKINKDKIAVVRQHDRQIVTGVVVNEKLQASKDYRKSIRLEMHYCQKYGIDGHLQRRPEALTQRLYAQVTGKLNAARKTCKKCLQSVERRGKLSKIPHGEGLSAGAPQRSRRRG